jgi:mono/diheme cytochrome c family protein
VKRIAVSVLLLWVGSAPTPSFARAPEGEQEVRSPQDLEFFEKKIRPLLTERCYSCHSAKAEKLKGGLYVDSHEGLLKGGDSGAALVAGDPKKSLLIKAVRWVDEDLKMPPKKRLTDEQIADLETWVRAGAFWPATDKAGAGKPRKQVGLTLEEGRKFWAYKAPRQAPGADIDRLILAGLAAQNLKPAPAADKAALLRRVTYDLIGLPPTPEEVDAFVGDASPDAYGKVVERLLASRQFGERWGRHWLDVARYAESLTLRGFIMKESWRYRDYVIDAFTKDVPYDRFIREQIAGDLLEAPTLDDRRRQLIAATFLQMGNTNLEEQDKKQLEMDVVDEQLDTIGRAFLAQTIACARCHDHKFDPIPTRDYYAIAGILKNARSLEHANVSKWLEVPLPSDGAREGEVKKQEEAIAALQAKIKAEKESTPKGKASKATGALAVSDIVGVTVDDAKAEKVGEWKLSTFSGSYIGAGYVHDDAKGKGEKSLTFHPDLTAGSYEVRFAYAPGESRATNVPVTILSADGEKMIVVNEQENPPIDGRYLSLGQYRFENNQGYVIVSNEGTKGHVTADAVVFVPVDNIDQNKAGAKSPAQGGRLKELEEELKKLQDSGPRRDMVMAVKEEKKIADVRIHIRGNVHTLGDLAPRGVLQVATLGAAPAMPATESGRRQLADWIAARENPLTARVMVNRVWHWLFGVGLVRTTDNFGTTGETPSHPELLDHLALQFVEDGWSIKTLIRRIVRTEAYRRASGRPGDVDPDNRLLGVANRRRLDAECIRDTMLSVSGRLRLDPPGGATYPASLNSDYGYKGASELRSVYVPVFRNALAEIFEVFDFADASVSTGRRNASTVAPQALYLLNNPFVLDQAKFSAKRLLSEGLADDRDRAVRAWRLALGRAPTEGEAAVALKGVAAAPTPEQGWASVFHALFASVEFRYVR